MNPEVAVWIMLAINLLGVVLMLGGKAQVLKDLGIRVTRNELKIESLEREKLSVGDYRRERDEFIEDYKDDRQSVNGRLDHIERAGWHGGGKR